MNEFSQDSRASGLPPPISSPWPSLRHSGLEREAASASTDAQGCGAGRGKDLLGFAGGVVKSSPTGELLLRATGKRRDGKSLEQLVLRAYPDGTRIYLRDVATITDGLAEQWFEWHHDGETRQGWAIHAEKNTVAVCGA